jgi:signal peptidase II
VSEPSDPPSAITGAGTGTGTGSVGRTRTGVLLVTALSLFVADLVSKLVVVATLSDRGPLKLLGGLVYLTEARNPGAAFSFAEGATLLFSAVAVGVIVVIVRTASRLRSVAWAVCLGLILGGAAGNLVDRLFRSPGPLRGAVVDWISVLDPYGQVWPIFNVADSGIVCGGVLAVVLAMFGYETDGRRHRRGRRAEREAAGSRPPAPVPPRDGDQGRDGDLGKPAGG